MFAMRLTSHGAGCCVRHGTLLPFAWHAAAMAGLFALSTPHAMAISHAMAIPHAVLGSGQYEALLRACCGQVV